MMINRGASPQGNFSRELLSNFCVWASCRMRIARAASRTDIQLVQVITILFLLCICAQIKFGKGEWVVGLVKYETKNDLSLYIIIPAVIVPMLLIIAISVYCYR